VIVGPPDRHDRLAVVAIVVHAGVTRVHFHYLAEPAEWNDGLGGLRIPPVKLVDDTGLVYKPAQSGPDCQGTGDPSEPGDFIPVTGDWQYKPAASDAQEFTVAHRGHAWVLRDPDS
jgi:hypothetical protein